jgi:hypothetical protein
MPAKAEQICARVAALLLNQTAAADRIYRDRADAFAREESPAILIEAIDEETESLGGGRRMTGDVDTDRLQFAVIVVVRGADWQNIADGVRVAAHAKIASDTQLQGIAASLRRQRAEWKAASADQPFGYLAQIYSAKSLTRAFALDVAP